MAEKKTKRKGMRVAATLPLMLLLLAALCQQAYASIDMGFEGEADQELPEEVGKQGLFIPYWEDMWIPICILAILVSTILHGMLYAIAYAFNLQGLKRYALSEMIQNAATAIIVVVLVGVLIQVFGLLAEAFESGGVYVVGENEPIKDPIDADIYTSIQFYTALNEMYQYVREADNTAEVYYSLQQSFFGITVFMGSWITSVWKEVETYHSIAYICVNLMIALSAKMFLLAYIKANMLSVFLPLGIILRTFHFTRGIGAFFMSIAIGFYFIYPLASFLMNEGYSTQTPNLPNILTTGMCNMPMFGSFSFGSVQLAQYGAGLAGSIGLSNDLATFVADLQTRLLYSNMVALALALTFIRFSTTILGGDATPFLGMVGRLV